MTDTTAETFDTGRPAAVIGGGRMGTGIAHALVLAGAAVTLIEVDAAAMNAAEQTVRALIGESARRGTLAGDAGQANKRLRVASSVDEIAGAALVIEAVPELPGLKAEVLGAIEHRVAETALIATNTSSISVVQLASGLRHPHRFLGMHFFNPVPASKLVEIVVGDATGGPAVTQARRWVDAMAKTAIVVKDSPGFASSRLGLALGLEAIRMVEQGVASPEDIDSAMVLGYRHPLGPLRLTDLVGLDVRLDIAEYLSSQLGARFEPPQLMRDMVYRGELGKKSGQGFYSW